MTDATTSRQPLVVGTDAAAMRRSNRILIASGTALTVLTAALATAVGIAVGSSIDLVTGLLVTVVALLPSAFFAWVTVYLVRTARRRESLGTVLILNEAGVESVMVQGTIVLPWSAVGSVVCRPRSLVFRLSDGVTAEDPEVRTDLTPMERRRVTRRGLFVGSVGIDADIDTIAAAASAFTGGRLAAR